MKCNRCEREHCPAYIMRESDIDPACMVSLLDDCASATLDRAMRAEATSGKPRCQHCGEAFERVKFVTYYATFAAWGCGCGYGDDGVKIERTEEFGY